MKTIGVFGGTFDPVHNAHIQMALSALSKLDLDEVRLIPCHQPPHRDQPQLTSRQRLHLLELATAHHPSLLVDDRELKRSGPSWTVDTLRDLRQEFGEQVSIVLLMGADAYSSLNSWHQWQQLPKLAHIAVFLRPGYSLPDSGPLSEYLDRSSSGQPLLLGIQNQPSGLVAALDQSQVDLSATYVREQLGKGRLPSGLDPAVSHYIVQHQLYGYKPN